MPSERAVCALSLIAASWSAGLILGRRGVWALGRHGPALAPAFLLILWFALFSLGQLFGSLGAAGATACAPLAILAALSVRFARPVRRSPYAWSETDRVAFALLLLLAFSFFGYDFECHYAVAGTYLRGNIPPSALNDPSRPMAYHALFDGAAALAARATGWGLDKCIGLASGACLAASLCALQAISRILFQRPAARQSARLLCLLGFGPIYLNILRHPEWFRLHIFFHGLSAQSFAESFLRRPLGLGYAVYFFVLAALLPRFSSPGRPAARAPHPAWLLPCAFLIPQISEELIVFAALPAIWLCATGRWPRRWLLILAGAVAAALPLSGVFRSALSSVPGVASPQPALAWPPTLPNWRYADPLPLFSPRALWMMLTDWGPLFFAGLALGWKNERRRVIVILWVAGFALACGLTLNHWIKADLDRFLFYGTCVGFMLTAGLIERLEEARLTPSRFRLAAGAILFACLLGPAGYLISNVFPRYRNPSVERLSAVDRTALRAGLAVVGPREQILTDDPAVMQNLVYAGFLVAASMDDHDVWKVNAERLPDYLAARAGLAPPWLFLPRGHALLSGRPEAGRFNGYILVRNQAL